MEFGMRNSECGIRNAELWLGLKDSSSTVGEVPLLPQEKAKETRNTKKGK